MRRNDYIIYTFTYNEKNYRIVGDEYDYDSLKLEKEMMIGSEEIYVDFEDETIKLYGHMTLMKEREEAINPYELGSFDAYLDGKDVVVTPDNVMNLYHKMIEEYNLPYLIFGLITYKSGAFRLYVRGDGYKGTRYISSSDSTQLENAYLYLFFNIARFLYEIFTLKKQHKYIEKTYYFDIDEYHGARGKLKECLDILIDNSNTSDENKFFASIVKKANEYNDEEMIRAKDYILRLGIENVLIIKKEKQI